MSSTPTVEAVPLVAKKENNPTVIAVAQRLVPSFWAWAASDPTAAALLKQGAAAIAEHLVMLLEHDGRVVVEAHAIIHDKDTREVWSDAQQAMVIELKPAHIHIVIKFQDRAGSAPIAHLASVLGLDERHVEKPGRGGHAADNMLSYLTHAKHEDKHQYAPNEVATIRGRDYLTIDRVRRSDWLKGRAHVKKSRAASNLEHLRELIISGKISKQQIMLTDEHYEVYARHSSELDDALNVAGQRRAYLGAAKLRAGEFTTLVLYVHGVAGIGKTRMALKFVEQAVAYAATLGETWHFYKAATGNPMDDWNGEEVVVLDDLRASAMDANDWLLLLDPHNASPARARYKNKGEVAPRIIIITATIEPVEFFFYARKKGEVDEALDQFLRRLASTVHVYRVGDDLQYRVQHTGQIESYQKVIRRNDTGYGPGSNMSREFLTLNYGPASETEYSQGGAIAALLLSLAKHSRDVPFHDSHDWASVERSALATIVAPASPVAAAIA